MGWKTDFKFLHERFKQVSRPAREELLCAMIRINYGTPWNGDSELVETFIPVQDHSQILHDNLTTLIETLSPFSDEPTEYGMVGTDQTAEIDRTNTITGLAKTKTKLFKQDFEETVTIHVPEKSQNSVA